MLDESLGRVRINLPEQLVERVLELEFMWAVNRLVVVKIVGNVSTSVR